LTKYSDLSEAEAEETETAAKTVKTAEATETAAVMVKAAAVTVKTTALMVKMVATVKMAMTVEAEEMAATVMTTAEKAAADITDGKGSGRQYIGGNTGSQVAFLRSGLWGTLQRVHFSEIYCS
jgi:hypothetical protein